jgi:hypothetical protein
MLMTPITAANLSIVLVFAFSSQKSDAPAIDNTAASKCFHEAEAAAKLDNGKLWGKSLYGPMLFVDPASRHVVTNQPSPEGALTREGDVYVGTLPNNISIANYAVSWAGMRWTMVMWGALSDDKYERLKLMMHESFHRIQDDLGYHASNPSNDHLDSMDGRYWLQLEWRALQTALNNEGNKRRDAIDAALTFRAYRRSLFPGAGERERELEMNEGLAEYSGAMLAAQRMSRKELINHISAQLDAAPKRPTFVRSFAYITGPAYGVLLDESSPGWRHSLKPQDDMALVLQQATKTPSINSTEPEAQRLAVLYDGGTLRTVESARDDVRKKTIAGYKARLLDGPTLSITLTDKHQYSFNPNNLIPLDSNATIYPTGHVIDAWGILDINNGAVFYNKNGMVTSIVVAAPLKPDTDKLSGDGWTLQLEKGWRIEPGEKQGCFVLRRAGI